MSPIRSRHRSHGLAALGALWILVATAPAFANAPELLSYQGVLMQDDGIVVEDGPWDLRFRLYPQELGGTHVFEQTLTVEVRDGLYNVVLSSQGGYDLLEVIEDHANLFMEVTVLAVPDPENGGQPTDVVLEPRQQLASVPYALTAAGSSSAPFDPGSMHDLVQKVTGSYQLVGPAWEEISVDDSNVTSGGDPLRAQVTVPQQGAWQVEVRTQIACATGADLSLNAAVGIEDSSSGTTTYWPLGLHWGGNGGGAEEMSLVRSILPATNGATYTVSLWAVGQGRVAGEEDAIALPFEHGTGKSTYIELLVSPLQ